MNIILFKTFFTADCAAPPMSVGNAGDLRHAENVLPRLLSDVAAIGGIDFGSPKSGAATWLSRQWRWQSDHQRSATQCLRETDTELPSLGMRIRSNYPFDLISFLRHHSILGNHEVLARKPCDCETLKCRSRGINLGKPAAPLS
jgi:hypothetical protein